jgi:hypothetical protein
MGGIKSGREFKKIINACALTYQCLSPSPHAHYTYDIQTQFVHLTADSALRLFSNAIVGKFKR